MSRALLTRFASALLLGWLVSSAAAQTQEEGQMRLYIQQLEERLRQLTGENERLTYELNQARAQLGLAPTSGAPQATGAVGPAPTAGVQVGANLPPASADEQQLGTMSIAPDDPLIAPDGIDESAPVDLQALAQGVAGEIVPPANAAGPGVETQMAGLPAAPTALSGSARDEYDLAYGYILTGDYGLAEQSFRIWLASFPGDAQASDAEFWLGESQLQQGKYRDAANSFLSVYKSAPDGGKGPDSLLKLGVALSALGEKSAACGTFAELPRRYPQASQSMMGRLGDEQARAGC